MILKFWLHISNEELDRRIKKFLKNKLTSWQVSPEDLIQQKKYAKYSQAVEDMLSRTDSPHAPWTIVEATDRYHARIKVLETIIKALETRLGLESSLGPKAKRRRKADELQGAVNA